MKKKKNKVADDRNNIPICEKYGLTIEEASVYFGIGQNRIMEMAQDPFCPFALVKGNGRGRYLIKRKLFEDYLNGQARI